MVRLLRVTAGALGCLFVVAFQLQLVPFFQRLFVNEKTFWPIIYYSCWTLVIVTTLLLLILQRSILMRVLPVLAVCAASAALTLVHPLELVAKNFLVGTAFFACGTVLAVASSPLALLRFSAAATVLTAVVCLLDIFFSHGFTNTVGRAAGLSINANVAAAGLFLGAASSFWAVPPRLRTSFLLIVGAAILVTLSRSTLLAALLVCGAVAADFLWARFKDTESHRPLQWASGSILTLVLASWITLALFTNDRFSVAATSSFRQIGTSVSALEEARESVAKAVQSKMTGPAPKADVYKPDVPKSAAPQQSPAGPKAPPTTTSAANTAAPRQGTVAPAPKPSVREEVAANFDSAEMIREIERRAENEGDINSISARGLLMERAFLSYQTGPVLGQGLGVAHALQPHNMFLTFAVAFGPIGWFVPLAFVALTIWWARSIQELPLLLATFTVMMTSHDVLFTPGLLAPIIFGIAGLNWLRHHADEVPYALPALPYAALAAPLMYAIGAISVVSIGATMFPFVPRPLLLLVFCAFALWAAGIWRWRREFAYRPDGAVRGG
jgi:hypothetical protein